VTIGPPRADDGRRRLDFVEVGATAAETTAAADDDVITVGVPASEPGWSLWGDLDR
jgi:hypothetical protein